MRKRFVIKKNQRKRQRDEKSEKQNEENSSKRSKVADEAAGQNESSKSEKNDTSEKSGDNIMVEAGPAAEQELKVETNSNDDNDGVEDPEENKSDDDNEHENGDDEEEEEDPEEIIEDDQEMNDVAPSNDGVQEVCIILFFSLYFENYFLLLHRCAYFKQDTFHVFNEVMTFKLMVSHYKGLTRVKIGNFLSLYCD